MGKPTGFLEYNRETMPEISPLERIKNFEEFHTPLPESERRKQGARCMNCGVPFCQSGMMLNGMATGCRCIILYPNLTTRYITAIHGMPFQGCLKPTIFRNLPAEYVRRCARLPACAE